MGDICQGKEFSRYAFRVCQNAYNFTSALGALMATKPYRKYYLINMDYAWGYDIVSAFKKQLKIHIPDAQVVGEDYHPLATKDYGPYITKAMAAKADVIFTGNYGPDSRTLIRQARALGLKVPFPFVTTFGVDPYVEFELKEDSVGIHYAYDYDMRVDTPENKAMYTKFHEQHKNDKDFYAWWPAVHVGHTVIGWQMLFAAVEKAGSLDPEKVIEAFEGFRYKSPVGWWLMRKCDHQVILPMFGGMIEAGKNPYYNGSIRSEVNFPWLGPNLITIPAEIAAMPATPDYNPRCQ
jgi:branched-chain amino acid transport system substrate-binding protein